MLLQQEHEEFKVICVDDHSSDGSAEIVRQFAGQDDRITYLSLKLDQGKKAALELGIKHCKTNWIITRDADTTCDPLNLAAISQTIDQDKSKEMWILPVVGHHKWGFFQELFALEFHALVATGLATAKGGIPIMANGANLAFTKSLFESLDGYRGNRSVSSGDDIFLLQKAVELDKKRIGVANHAETVVSTFVPENLGTWFDQKVRWGGKFKWNASLPNTLIAILVLLTNIARAMYLPIMLFPLYHMGLQRFDMYFIMSIGLTLWADHLLLTKFSAHFNQKVNQRSLFFAILVYPYLFLGSVLGSLFYRPKWKGRKIEV